MKSFFRRLFLKIAAIANNRLKRRSNKVRRDRHLTSGFTLIELIVAALIASLMVVVMLSFLVGVLESDRKETAKSNAQEELQAAIAYIADDLQEAMYIYGAEGIAGINDQLPHTQTQTGTSENKCTSTDCTPILVFWKRTSFSPDTEKNYSNGSGKEKLGCMPYKDTTVCKSEDKDINPYKSAFGREIYVYSLVAYYLKSDVGLDSTWSDTARILRWEISDGYPWSCSTGGTITDTTTCPTTFAVNRDGLTGNPPALVSSTNSLIVPAASDEITYFIKPDKGFNRPDFSSATSILSWKRFTSDADGYDLSTNPFVTLIDFMDDTAYDATQGGNDPATGTGAIGTAALRIPVGKNVTISGVITNPDCDDPSIGVGNTNPVTTTNAAGTVTQRVPADFSDATINPSGLSSFYTCVAPSNVTVRLFLRGNALARLGSDPQPRNFRQPTTTNTSFFPTANARSFGRSAIGISK
jgi:type II secretory pathway pseudopilin PulG